MGMSKAIIAPRLPPIEDVVRHGENGIMFQQLDKDSLKSAVMTLVQDKQFRETLGRNARELVEKKHLWRHISVNLSKCTNLHSW